MEGCGGFHKDVITVVVCIDGALEFAIGSCLSDDWMVGMQVMGGKGEFRVGCNTIWASIIVGKF